MHKIENPHLRNRILTDKERKNLIILDIVRKNGPISRTDISHLTDFNIVTVSNYINHYIETGLAFEKELDESTGGRKPVLVSLNPDAGFVVGVGLNPDSMVAIMVNLECHTITEVRREREPYNGEETVSQLISLIEELISKSGADQGKILGIGIGVPGIIDEKKKTIRWPGALGDEDAYIAIDFKTRFETKFKIPVLVENDANAAVLAEKWLGLGRDVNHMIYAYSGIGLGIMIDGEIYSGANGVAGELGISSENGSHSKAGTNFYSTLGRWKLDLGMIDKLEEAIKAGKTSSLQKVLKSKKKLTIRDIAHATKKGDGLAQETVKEAGKVLGRKLAFLVNLMNPEVIVIGGGIEECGNVLLDSIKSAVEEWAFEEAASRVRIIPAAFGEKTVALGAVGIVCREVFAQA